MDWKDAVHQLKQKERVRLQAKKVEKVEPPKKPFNNEKRESSRGLVSHIWNEWQCKNFDV